MVGSTDEDPVGHFVNENHLDSRPHGTPSIGAAVAQSLDMGEVTGSNPVSTIALRGKCFTKSKVRYNSAVAFTIPVYEAGSATYCREQLGDAVIS